MNTKKGRYKTKKTRKGVFVVDQMTDKAEKNKSKFDGGEYIDYEEVK